MAREKTNWFELWFQDKTSMLETMVRNLQADLACGYDPKGNCVTKQTEMIKNYKLSFDKQMDEFKFMGAGNVNRWCYYDLRKRGAIA